MLQDRHSVVAVVPHHESTVHPLHHIATKLGLSWAQPDVIPMFRNKAVLKYLRPSAPHIRVNATRTVTSGADARAFAQECGATRIVLKPVDGAGNMNVAFFNADDPEERFAGYFAGATSAILAEEYIGGDEF